MYKGEERYPIKIRRAYIALGRVDLRMGIDGLSSLVEYCFQKNPMEEGTIYLFKGRKSDRIKGLMYDGTGFVLLTKRMDGDMKFHWPKSEEELESIGPDQFSALMQGLVLDSR